MKTKTYLIDGEIAQENEFKTLLRLQAEEAYRSYYDTYMDDLYPAVVLPENFGFVRTSVILKALDGIKYGYAKDEFAKTRAIDHVNTLFMFDNFEVTLQNMKFTYELWEAI